MNTDNKSHIIEARFMEQGITVGAYCTTNHGVYWRLVGAALLPEDEHGRELVALQLKPVEGHDLPLSGRQSRLVELPLASSETIPMTAMYAETSGHDRGEPVDGAPVCRTPGR